MSQPLPEKITEKAKEQGFIALQSQHTNLAFLETDIGRKQFNVDELAKHVLSLEGRHRRIRKVALKPKKKLTSAEKRSMRLFSVSECPQNYSSYLPLHSLWCDYMRSVFHPQTASLENNEQINGILSKADYHGCIMSVLKSKCPSYVGTTGILVKETKNTLTLISKDNRMRVIPKQNSVFTFDLDEHLFTIYGNYFRIKSSERSVRKIKTKPTTQL